MTSGEPPATPPPSGRVSTPRSSFPLWTKLLLGCVGLWVLLILTVGITGWVVFRRLAAPAEPVVTEAFVGPDAEGWARLRSVRSDPGLRGLVSHFVSEVQRQDSQEQREALPEWARGLHELAQANRNDAAWLGMLLPGGGLVRFEVSPESGELATVAILDGGLLARAVGWTSSWNQGSESYRGFGLIPLSNGGYLGLKNGNLLAATDSRTLERAVDRLEAGAAEGADAEPAPVPLPEGFEDERWDLAGILDNRQGAFNDTLVNLAASWPRVATAAGPRLEEAPGEAPATPAADAVESASFRLDVVTADRLEGRVELEVADPVAAWAWAERLAAGNGWQQDGLRFTVRSRNEARRVVADFELEGVEGWMTRALEASPDGSR